jgi:hypothetical protein
MRKELKLIFLLILFSLILASLLHTVYAAEPSNPNEAVQGQLGINPEKLNPEDIQRTYLQQEWSKIAANNSVIGPVHRFFVAHPLVFRVIFKEPYSFSLTFILVLIMWFLVAFNIKKIVASAQILVKQKWAAWLMGIAFAVILAQSGVYTAIANFILNLILAKENFWIRVILWVVFCAAVILIYYLGDMVSKQLKASREAKEKAKTEQAGKEVQATAQGLKRQ